MERRNTILLTVIAIATLSVAVVGATFAYFTATTNPGGTNNQNVNTNTAKIGGINFNFNSQSTKHEYLNYPGGVAVFGAKADISKAQTEDTNDYDVSYNLKIVYTNDTSTDLDWELYVSDNVDINDSNSLDPKCVLNNHTEGLNTYFWYDNTISENYSSGACTFTDDQTQTFKGIQKIAHGKLSSDKTDDSGVINSETIGGTELDSSYETNPLKARTLNTKSLTSKYYYLVVSYPNSGNQTDDATGKTIKVSLQLDGQPDTKVNNED